MGAGRHFTLVGIPTARVTRPLRAPRTATQAQQGVRLFLPKSPPWMVWVGPARQQRIRYPDEYRLLRRARYNEGSATAEVSWLIYLDPSNDQVAE